MITLYICLYVGVVLLTGALGGGSEKNAGSGRWYSLRGGGGGGAAGEAALPISSMRENGIVFSIERAAARTNFHQ